MPHERPRHLQDLSAATLGYFFEDQAEWRNFFHLTKASASDGDTQAWTGLVYRNLRLFFEYRMGERADFFCYRTRSGVNKPLACHLERKTIGIIPIISDQISHKQLMGAQSFLKKYPNSQVVFISNLSRDSKKISDRIDLLSATRFLFE